VPHLRGRRPRVLRRRPSELPPRGRDRGLAADQGILRPAPRGLTTHHRTDRERAVCTYLTEKIRLSGSGKGAQGWFTLTDATVYFAPPQHPVADHTLNIAFLRPAAGPSARGAVELTAGSARELAQAILTALDAVPPGVIGTE